MNQLALSAILAFASCAAPAPAAPPAPTRIVVVEVPPTPPPPEIPKPVATVTQQYRNAAQKEVAAVTLPDVTADYVRQVHQADTAARTALTALERQGVHPTAEVLTRARAAVQRLMNILQMGLAGEEP